MNTDLQGMLDALASDAGDHLARTAIADYYEEQGDDASAQITRESFAPPELYAKIVEAMKDDFAQIRALPHVHRIFKPKKYTPGQRVYHGAKAAGSRKMKHAYYYICTHAAITSFILMRSDGRICKCGAIMNVKQAIERGATL